MSVKRGAWSGGTSTPWSLPTAWYSGIGGGGWGGCACNDSIGDPGKDGVSGLSGGGGGTSHESGAVNALAVVLLMMPLVFVLLAADATGSSRPSFEMEFWPNMCCSRHGDDSMAMAQMTFWRRLDISGIFSGVLSAWGTRMATGAEPFSAASCAAGYWSDSDSSRSFSVVAPLGPLPSAGTSKNGELSDVSSEDACDDNDEDDDDDDDVCEDEKNDERESGSESGDSSNVVVVVELSPEVASPGLLADEN